MADGTVQDTSSNFTDRRIIFNADNFLHEDLNPDFGEPLGGFKTCNPVDNRFQRPIVHISPAKSKFKKTVELVLCAHGWKSPDKQEPMTLIVLGVNLSCHDRDSRFESVHIRLSFGEDDKRDPADDAKAHPQIVAYAPFVQQERWNVTTEQVKSNKTYVGSVGVGQFGQVGLNASNKTEIQSTRKYFDRGSAERLYDDRTGTFYGIEWYYEQNRIQNYGVMPHFHLAVLLKRSHNEGRAVSFKAELDMRTEAGHMYDFQQGMRRFFRLWKSEDDPVYFDPSKEKPDVYGVAGIGEELLKNIETDNLGILAEGKLLSKLVGSVGFPLDTFEPILPL
ncbi:hypothetical protein ACQKWADRAFT_278398 [Trichoderma austrokoningii]